MLYIGKDTLNFIKDISTANSPHEICGLLTGRRVENDFYIDRFHLIDNVSTNDPKWDFVMDPLQLMQTLDITNYSDKQSDIYLCGIVHSHPLGKAIPSRYDINDAKNQKLKTSYLIYSVPDNELKGYIWIGNHFEEIDISIV